MLDTPDTVKFANRRKFLLVFMASAILLALIFMVLAIRDQTERAKAEREAAQTVAYQAPVPMTPEQQQAAEQYAKENGEYISYSDFYAKAESTGLPIGKRYRFRAAITKALYLDDLGEPSGVYRMLHGYPAFDSTSQYEDFLKNNSTSGEIVASMGDDGRIMIHRVD